MLATSEMVLGVLPLGNDGGQVQADASLRACLGDSGPPAGGCCVQQHCSMWKVRKEASSCPDGHADTLIARNRLDGTAAVEGVNPVTRWPPV